MKKFYWLNKESEAFLKNGYILEGTTPQQRVRDIADHAEKLLGMEGYADKFYDYMSKGYYSLSSPIWSNFGLSRGLPISCFGSFIDDSMESILYTHAEVGMMTKVGGGTSAYFGALRPRGAKITDNGNSNGSYTFAQLFDKIIDVVSQGETRRGHFAGYIDVEHSDIHEWLNIQSEGDPIQDIYYGVCITDEWFEGMIAGDPDKRAIWAKILQSRINLGIPYIMFKDTVNKNTVDVYKDKGLIINASNLCSEICLPANTLESFVCCLSSMNLLHYDEWKDTDAPEVLTYFLDAVIQDFIDKASQIKFMERAVEFAKNHRAIGVGVLGWHSYLQSKNIAFESFEASMLNAQIFKTIHTKTKQASKDLASLLGEPPILEGYGRRNTTLMSIAPTKSSSFILGQVSPSIEALTSNYFVRDSAKVKHTYKNPYLIELLESKGKNTPEVWNSIALHDGSVQHLEFLSEHEKDVFKTSIEITPMTMIKQAAQRQRYIDQSQSLNLSIDPSKTSIKDINALYIEAWELGIKTLYYQHSVNASQELSRNILNCVSCEA